MSKDTFTLKQIEKAWYKSSNWDEMEDRLRQEPKFSEWQVVHVSYLVDDQPTGEYVALSPDDLAPYQAHKLKNCRPLNQSEVGEGWVSKARVDKLVDRLQTTQKNIQNWFGGAEAKWASIFNEEWESIQTALDEYNNGQEG